MFRAGFPVPPGSRLPSPIHPRRPPPFRSSPPSTPESRFPHPHPNPTRSVFYPSSASCNRCLPRFYDRDFNRRGTKKKTRVIHFDDERRWSADGAVSGRRVAGERGKSRLVGYNRESQYCVIAITIRRTLSRFVFFCCLHCFARF